MSKIQVVLAKAHKLQEENPDIQRELKDVQLFFDQNDFPFETGTIYFVILRGLYLKLEKKLNVIGVFVNKTGFPVDGFRAALSLHAVGNEQARFAEAELDFTPQFLGRLQPEEAFLLHIHVPAEGLDPEKDSYEATELGGTLSDLEILVQK